MHRYRQFAAALLLVVIVCAVQISAEVWVPKALLPSSTDFAATAMHEGKMFVISGWSAAQQKSQWMFQYSVDTDEWSSRSEIPEAVCEATAQVFEGRIYVVSGHPDCGGCEGAPPTPNVQVYHIATDTWSPGVPMITARHAAASGIINGVLFVVGGITGLDTLRSVEGYVFSQGQWATFPEMHTPRGGCTGAVLDGSLWIIGGLMSQSTEEKEDDSQFLQSVERFDPVAQKWHMETPLPFAREQHGAAAANGRLFVFSAMQQDTFISKYDPAMKVWSEIGVISDARFLQTPQVWENVIYIAGGFDRRLVAVAECFDDDDCVATVEGQQQATCSASHRCEHAPAAAPDGTLKSAETPTPSRNTDEL